jgi:enterochelin esterase-like enzyme
MKTRNVLPLLALLAAGSSSLARAQGPIETKTRPTPAARPAPQGGQQESYPDDPDNHVKADVPKGKTTKMPNWKSQVFDHTDREWWVYVPSQYTADKPACVMIFQDGGGYKDRVPVVFDNLIAKGDMPVTIGIFIQPGNLLPEGTKRGNSQRSFEYDTVSDQYSRFLLEEILPEVEKTVKLRHDAASRAVAGLSSGASCAFTAAWFRPDQFSKVLSWIGSYTDLAGGKTGIEGAHNYPFMIRRGDKKPIRVFLQDGDTDLDNQFGNWPLANQSMAKALAFKGYDYKFEFGHGSHSGTHGYAILPASLKWLWRDYKPE